MAYAFDALTSNEFHNTEIPCAGPNLIPNGPGYGPEVGGQSCVGVVGAAPGDTSVFGNSYLAALSYSHSHVWRNFGIIVAFWIFWAFMAAVGFEVNLASGTGAKVLFDRSSRQRELVAERDPEKAVVSSSSSSSDYKGDVSVGETTFTFENIDYFVHHEGKEKQLLQSVSGYVKPGQLVALMGSSGAGKTTLMDVLAQRKDSGRIEGSIMVSAIVSCPGICIQIANSHHRSMDTLKASLSSAPLDTVSKTTFMSQPRRCWNPCCSLLDCAKATTPLTKRKFVMCTASWIFWS